MFDIWYRNTSDIVPTAITGDMHSVNKANFGILYCFGRRFEPRFTDLDERLKDLYCADDLALYEKCLVRPVGQIDRQTIMDEKTNIDQIIATVVLGNLGLTCDRTDSIAFLVFERASSDFTRPMSSARNASGRFAKSLVAAAAVSVNEAAQGHRPVRMESRRRCLYAARRS